MRIAFWKMHGAGNDFILADDRALSFPAADGAWLARVCARRTGVGAEGAILIQPSASAHFRMRFFNPDGREVEMCGNGARCVARLAHELGVAPADMRFETEAGPLRARARGGGDEVLLYMTEPLDWRMDRRLDHEGRTLTYHFVNSGVPHAVVEVDDLAAAPVAALGAHIRRHADFAPRGTNANFISADGPGALRIRTYERGVEAETLACGTGIVAGALVAGRLGRVRPPVGVTTAGGDRLEVDWRADGEAFTGVTLRGPAVHVFQGVLDYPGGG